MRFLGDVFKIKMYSVTVPANGEVNVNSVLLSGIGFLTNTNCGWVSLYSWSYGNTPTELIHHKAAYNFTLTYIYMEGSGYIKIASTAPTSQPVTLVVFGG